MARACWNTPRLDVLSLLQDDPAVPAVENTARQGEGLEKNEVVSTSSQDEAVAHYGVSREVHCSALKWETVPDTLCGNPKSSPHRYEGELLNSFGHPVPRINGTLQKTGGEVQARILEFEQTEKSVVYTLDLSSAYAGSGAERVVRRYEYTRAGGETPNRLTVTDTVTFAPDAPRTADFPLITFENWRQTGERTIEITPRPAKDGSVGPGIRVTVSARDENGNPVPGRFAEEIVGRDDPLTPKKPKRIAWETELAEGRTLTVVTTIE